MDGIILCIRMRIRGIQGIMIIRIQIQIQPRVLCTVNPSRCSAIYLVLKQVRPRRVVLARIRRRVRYSRRAGRNRERFEENVNAVKVFVATRRLRINERSRM